MRSIRFAAPLAALAMLSTAFAADPAPPTQAVDAFHAALKAGDRNGALAQLSSDARIYEQGFAEMSAKEYGGKHLAADLAFSAAVPRVIRQRETGQSGDVAWVLTLAQSKGKFQDNEVDLEQAETMLLRRDGERWKIVHIHWSAHAAE